jgi:hypothetical protein
MTKSPIEAEMHHQPQAVAVPIKQLPCIFGNYWIGNELRIREFLAFIRHGNGRSSGMGGTGRQKLASNGLLGPDADPFLNVLYRFAAGLKG